MKPEEFFEGMPIVKDVGCIRAKGILLEEALLILEEECSLKLVHSDNPVKSFLYEEYGYAGEAYGTEVKVLWMYFRGSVPYLGVAVESKATWIKLRQKLRDAGLVR